MKNELLALVIAIFGTAAVNAASFYDPLTSRTDSWYSESYSDNASAAEVLFTSAGLVNRFGATDYGSLGTGYQGKVKAIGNFDARVNFTVAPYTPSSTHSSGLRIQFGILNSPANVERDGYGTGDVYLSNLYWNINTVPTADTSGTLRLVRDGTRLYAYYATSSGWGLVSSTTLTLQDQGAVAFGLGAGFASTPLLGHDVDITFSNFQLTAADVIPVPEPGAGALLLASLGLLIYRGQKP